MALAAQATTSRGRFALGTIASRSKALAVLDSLLNASLLLGRSLSPQHHDQMLSWLTHRCTLDVEKASMLKMHSVCVAVATCGVLYTRVNSRQLGRVNKNPKRLQTCCNEVALTQRNSNVLIGGLIFEIFLPP
jgi:hypothetical protein